MHLSPATVPCPEHTWQKIVIPSLSKTNSDRLALRTTTSRKTAAIETLSNCHVDMECIPLAFARGGIEDA